MSLYTLAHRFEILKLQTVCLAHIMRYRDENNACKILLFADRFTCTPVTDDIRD